MISHLLTFFGGRDLDGGRRTNARWSKPGTELVDGDHFTTRKWHYWPHRRRAGIRVGYVGAVAYFALAAVFDPQAAVDSGRLAFWSCFTVFVWWVIHRTRRLQWREERIVPAFLAAADLLGFSRHVDPVSVIRVPKDYLTNPDHPVVVSLPPAFTGTKAMRDRLVAAISSRLGMVNPDPEWAVEGREPKLLLRAAPAPPERVGMAVLRPMLEARAPGEIVLGGGPRQKCVKANLDEENPHIALSVTTGGGKSVTASLVAMQVLHDGGIALIADPKVVSLQWAKYLANVRYADSIAAIHEAFVWLGEEIDRRMELIGQLADVDGNVDPSLVGPRILVVCEELNTMMPRLNAYWQSIRDAKEGDPKASPAVAGFRAGLAMGRQGRVHMLCIAQYLTAAVTGGGDGRENLTTRILVKPSFKAWNMLGGPEYKIGSKFPPTLPGAGRGYVLHNGVATPVQLGYPLPREAQEYATSGEVTPFRSTLPTLSRLGAITDPVPGDNDVAHARDQGEEQGQSPGTVLAIAPTPADEEPLVSLSEAVQRGILTCSLDAAKKRRTRGDLTAPPVEEDPRRGFLYRPADLRADDLDYAREASAR
jgi:hypothetical protein